MKELLVEIWASIRANKLRTVLTGFSVAWGIFMLIILLGSGNGLRNGVLSNFEGRSTNKISVYGGRTQQSYAGYQKNRSIRLDYRDIEELAKLDGVENIGGVKSTYGELKTDKEQLNSNITGVSPCIERLMNHEVIEGRYINQRDIDEKRKVILINRYTKDVLFKNEDPINKYVRFDNVNYVVVGVIKEQFEGQYPSTYIPLSTHLSVYTADDKIRSVSFEISSLKTEEENLKFEDLIRETLGSRHEFSKDDKGAIWISNSVRDFLQFQVIFMGITLFIWIIGLGTLMAGIVGVSNIMLVAVRERTNEFGIRKSMGATPSSLVRLILLESILITAFFGYIGMVGGTILMEIVSYVLDVTFVAKDNMPVVFKNPTVDLMTTLYATITLIIAGAIAGYVPAKRAAKLKTIDALRYNK